MSHLHQNQTDFDSDSQNQQSINKNSLFLNQFKYSNKKISQPLSSKSKQKLGAQTLEINKTQNQTLKVLSHQQSGILQSHHSKINNVQTKLKNIQRFSQQKKVSKYGFQTISFKKQLKNNEVKTRKYQQKQNNISQPIKSVHSIFDSRSCCKTLIPITFADTLYYQQKHLQLLNLQTFKNKIDIIQFITQNNRQLFQIQNCHLLNFIQLDKFWQIVIPEMIHDVTEYSHKLSAGKLQLSLKGYISTIKINKFYCYILLCQMFFGLIPYNFHNNIDGKTTYPSFGKLFESAKTNQSLQNIDEKQLNNLNKIKCLIFYFTSMVDQKRKTQSRNSSITIQRQKYFIQEDLFYNCNNAASQHNQKFAISEEDYGPLGDQKLANFKFQIQDKFNYGQTFVRIVQVDTLIDQSHTNKEKQKNITTSFYQHPQLFILKVVCGELEKNECIGVYGCDQFSRCLYAQNFQCICSSQLQKQQNKSFSFIIVSQPKKRYNIKRYYFHHLKQKVQLYICFLNLAAKNQNLTKKNTKIDYIKIPFCLLNHEDPYLNFLLMWVAISLSKLKHHSMLVISLNNGRYQQTPQIYTYKKIIQQMKNQEVGDVMAIINGFRQYQMKKRVEQRKKQWETKGENMNLKQRLNSKMSQEMNLQNIKSREYNFKDYLKKVAI